MSDEAHPNPNVNDDPSASPLILGTILGIVLTVVTIIASAALYFREENRLIKAVVEKPGTLTVQQLHAGQQNRLLAAAGWSDKSKQTVTVSIDTAMNAILKEYADGRSPASVPTSRPQPTP